MRNIYFVSNLHDEHYPNNTRSKFSTCIHPSCLSYISDGPIEAAVIAVSIDYSGLSNGESLGIRSNICQPIISSSEFDALLCWFDVDTKDDNSIIHKSFMNPAFFPTTKEQLANANFEIIDLKNKKTPNFSTGSPTFIIVAVKRQIPRMKTPFNVLLDSGCLVSKTYFPNNNGMEFTIQLPKRLEFRKDWIVALKSISFTNTFYNIYDFSVETEDKSGTKTTFLLNEGYYNTLEDWLTEIYKKLSGFLWVKKDSTSNKVIIYPMKQFKSVQFSKNMKKFLKLPSSYTVNFFQTNSRLESEEPIDISVLIPQHFLICCNMIEHSIVGGQQLQILKLISNETSNKKKEGTLFHYESFNNEFIKIGLKEFDKITIKIMNIGGSRIKCASDVPTRLQLLFVNTNSS